MKNLSANAPDDLDVASLIVHIDELFEKPEESNEKEMESKNETKIDAEDNPADDAGAEGAASK